MVTKSQRRATEGCFFVVPLRDEGFGVGLIARNRAAAGTVGYFFGKRFADVPALDEVLRLNREDVVYIERFVDLPLYNGRWKVIGRHPRWNDRDWPMPAFKRIARTNPQRATVVQYDDFGKEVSATRVTPDEVAGLPDDGYAGYGIVEMKLTEALGGKVEVDPEKQLAEMRAFYAERTAKNRRSKG